MQGPGVLCWYFHCLKNKTQVIRKSSAEGDKAEISKLVNRNPVAFTLMGWKEGTTEEGHLKKFFRKYNQIDLASNQMDTEAIGKGKIWEDF